MIIQLKSDADYNALVSAMVTILQSKSNLQYSEFSYRKTISENPFLSAGRDAIITYLDEAQDACPKWLDLQQEYIFVQFFIQEGRDY